MSRSQSDPRQWLIIDRAIDWRLHAVLRRVPLDSGVLLLRRPHASELRHLRQLARLRRLRLVTEAPRTATRVHDVGELRRALLERTPVILLSPIYKTRSHPDWKPLPRMRAAALSRLAKRRLIALGGMDARRHAKIAPLGFIGWAGISAFRT
jgi:thiamine-phosphate pyrophosphorylase